VEPADDLDLGPVFFRDLGDQLGDDRVGTQQVVGQQQLGFVVDALEEEGHGGGKHVALGDQQQAVELAVLVAGELELGDVGGIQAGQFAAGGEVGGVGEDVRQAGGGGAGKH